VVALGAALALLVPTPSHGEPLTRVGIDWSTYGFDLARTGFNPFETTIGVDNAGSLHELWSYHLGGQAVNQASYATGVLVHGQPRNVVYVGATDGYLYAVNADTGVLIWRRWLGLVPSAGCGTYGIGGSSTIDRAANRIYVPAATGRVFALDLSTGAVAAGWPVVLTRTPRYEYMWSALTLVGTQLYAALASYCDQPPYFGRLVRIDVRAAKPDAVFYVTGDPAVSGGAIWGWGGASVDPSGDVFVATGNALDANEAFGYSEQVVRLTANLSVVAANYPGLTGFDVDFGATPVLYQAPGCPPQLAVENKDGELFVYDRDTIDAGPFQRIHTANYGVSGLIGLPAYSPPENMVFVANPSDSPDGTYKAGLLAFAVQPDCTLALTWQRQYGEGVVQNTPPTPTVANGVVYSADGGFVVPSTLRAFDALTGELLWSTQFDGGSWSSPIVVNGKVFTAPGDDTLHAFGL